MPDERWNAKLFATHRERLALCAVILACVPAQVPAQPVANPVAVDVAVNCRTQVSRNWRAHYDVQKVNWTGACRDGLAVGPGVLEWEGTDLRWDVRTRGAARLMLPAGEILPVVPTALHAHAIHLQHGRDRFTSLRLSRSGTESGMQQFVSREDIPDWAQFAASGIFSPRGESIARELPAGRSALERDATPVPAMPRGRATALVIGNSAYAMLDPLANPRRDATAIAAKLREMGFEVTMVLDAGRDALLATLRSQAAGARADDLSVIYYAGHGVQLEGVNYLVPVDLQPATNTASLKAGAVSLNLVLAHFPTRTRIVFLDACRDLPLIRSVDTAASETAAPGRASSGIPLSRSLGTSGLAPVSASRGTLIAYATRDGATAADGDGEHSPYTAALLQHLGKPLDISLVLRQVRQSVLQATDQRQEPWEYGSLSGDELILSRAAK